jgi:hypothetical protein
MIVTQHKTAREFLERAGESLERAEAENNLLLGISKYYEINPGRTNVNPYFLTVEDSGILFGAALMTPHRHLIISRIFDPALVALTDYFLKESIPVPGLFAEHWKNRTGKGSRVKMSQGLYACERVVVQVYSRGHLRPAMESDEALLVQWSGEFCREAGIEDEIESTKARIPSDIANQSLYVEQRSGSINGDRAA